MCIPLVARAHFVAGHDVLGVVAGERPRRHPALRRDPEFGYRFAQELGATLERLAGTIE
jgi:hypothetical protein